MRVRRSGRVLVAVCVALLSVVALATPAAAHPLGNFTVNHYSGLTVSRDSVTVQAVVDLAEIPTAQARPEWDPDGSGEASTEEGRAYAAERCDELAAAATLRIDGQPALLQVQASEASFPPGQAGLPTLRVVCALQAPVDVSGEIEVSYSDPSDDGRVGWREIVARGDRTTLLGSTVPTSSLSRQLTEYPTDRLSSPLDVREASFRVRPGGASADPDPAGAVTGFLPQGVDDAFTGLVTGGSLGLSALLLSLLLAVVLGAGHAFLPGHGKTIMAAYIVGRRGTVSDAVLVGATVTATHTGGVLALGGLVSATTAFAPEQAVRSLALISGLIVTGIGVVLLVGSRARRNALVPVPAAVPDDDLVLATGHGHAHGHPEPKGHPHDDGGHGHADGGHSHGGHSHGHSHGGHSHAHGPDDRFSRTGLIGIGMAGGLVPSPSALLVLLAAFGLGQPVFGVGLVLCYGLGMSLALTVAGLALVRLRERFERLTASRGYGRLARIAAALPVVTAGVVLLTGLLLTLRAIGQLL